MNRFILSTMIAALMVLVAALTLTAFYSAKADPPGGCLQGTVVSSVNVACPGPTAAARAEHCVQIGAGALLDECVALIAGYNDGCAVYRMEGDIAGTGHFFDDFSQAKFVRDAFGDKLFFHGRDIWVTDGGDVLFVDDIGVFDNQRRTFSAIMDVVGGTDHLGVQLHLAGIVDGDRTFQRYFTTDCRSGSLR